MAQAVEIKKVKLEEAKQKIILQEKLIKEIERKKRARNFSEVGRIAFKADIDEIDKDAMFGAFLEISEKLKSGNSLENWKEKAKLFLESNDQKKQVGYSVIFSKDLSVEVKQIMKNLGFKWNRIRKEFYGYSDLKTLQFELKNSDAKITEIL